MEHSLLKHIATELLNILEPVPGAQWVLTEYTSHNGLIPACLLVVPNSAPGGEDNNLVDVFVRQEGVTITSCYSGLWVIPWDSGPDTFDMIKDKVSHTVDVMKGHKWVLDLLWTRENQLPR